MEEEDIKELIVDALQMNLDDCEVVAKRKGILLRFLSGEEWLIPEPLNLSEDEDDGDAEG